MNTHFDPNSAMSTYSLPHSFALVTASHAPDFERCRLLCETVDRWVTGARRHYILVAAHDVKRFRQLETPTRVVIDERELLPSWLHPVRDPLSLMRRHVWLSTRTLPLRGWHVQQLRRIGLAELADEEVLVYCDSDVAFVRPFDCGQLAGAEGTGLFRRPDGLGPGSRASHLAWVANAGRVLGLPERPARMHDYIATLIAWRKETVRGMCRHIEEVNSRHWAAAIAARRDFSECMLYGRYVDEVLNSAGHVHTQEELCRVMWFGKTLSDDQLRDFIASMGPEQVAVGIQSFIEVAPDRLRNFVMSAKG
jgi:hypothetical protein